MNEVLVKILQGSYTNHIRSTNYTSSSCKFPTVYMCEKLRKLVESGQSYCNKKTVQFLAHTV